MAANARNGSSAKGKQPSGGRQSSRGRTAAASSSGTGRSGTRSGSRSGGVGIPPGISQHGTRSTSTSGAGRVVTSQSCNPPSASQQQLLQQQPPAAPAPAPVVSQQQLQQQQPIAAPAAAPVVSQQALQPATTNVGAGFNMTTNHPQGGTTTTSRRRVQLWSSSGAQATPAQAIAAGSVNGGQGSIGGTVQGNVPVSTPTQHQQQQQQPVVGAPGSSQGAFAPNTATSPVNGTGLAMGSQNLTGAAQQQSAKPASAPAQIPTPPVKSHIATVRQTRSVPNPYASKSSGRRVLGIKSAGPCPRQGGGGPAGPMDTTSAISNESVHEAVERSMSDAIQRRLKDKKSLELAADVFWTALPDKSMKKIAAELKKDSKAQNDLFRQEASATTGTVLKNKLTTPVTNINTATKSIKTSTEKMVAQTGTLKQVAGALERLSKTSSTQVDALIAATSGDAVKGKKTRSGAQVNNASGGVTEEQLTQALAILRDDVTNAIVQKLQPTFNTIRDGMSTLSRVVDALQNGAASVPAAVAPAATGADSPDTKALLQRLLARESSSQDAATPPCGSRGTASHTRRDRRRSTARRGHSESPDTMTPRAKRHARREFCGTVSTDPPLGNSALNVNSTTMQAVGQTINGPYLRATASGTVHQASYGAQVAGGGAFHVQHPVSQGLQPMQQLQQQQPIQQLPQHQPIQQVQQQQPMQQIPQQLPIQQMQQQQQQQQQMQLQQQQQMQNAYR